MLKLSSGPIESAWALLKAPEEGLDERMLAQLFDNLPPELQERAHLVSQAVQQMPPEQLRALENHSRMFLEAQDLNSMLHQSHGMRSPMRKGSVPLDIIYEGRIAKVVPLIIGGIFVVDAVLRSQGQQKSFIGATLQGIGNAALGDDVIPPPDWSDTIDFNDEMGYIDPLGNKHEVEDANALERIGLGLASGASAAFNPFGLVGGTARMAGRGTARGASAALGRAGAGRTTRLAERAGTKAGEKAFKETSELPGLMSLHAPQAQREAYEAAYSAAGPGRLTQASDYLGRYDPSLGHRFAARSRFFQGAGRGMQAAGSAGLPNYIVPLLAGGAAQQMDFQPNMGGYTAPSQSGFAGANVGGSGGGFALDSHIGGVQNIHSVAQPHDAIFAAARGQGPWHGRTHLVQTGENMKIGERMLKDVTELMHKAHCMGAVKEDSCPKDCPGCPKCEGDNKKKADKKPAHGMVIVIGSKAGPGPSTDGKRDKLDSEKDKKDE
jgi:hypothetical protein